MNTIVPNLDKIVQSLARRHRSPVRAVPFIDNGFVSASGKVFTIDDDGIVHTHVGDRAVSVVIDGQKNSMHIGRVVALVFHGPPPDDKNRLVLHANDNRQDNSAENVYWGNYSQNAMDARRNNRFPQPKPPKIAKEHVCRELTRKTVLPPMPENPRHLCNGVETLRRLLVEKNISIMAFTRLADCSWNTARVVLTCHTRPRYGFLVNMEKHFGISLEDWETQEDRDRRPHLIAWVKSLRKKVA